MVKDRLNDLRRANDSSFDGNQSNKNVTSFRLDNLKSETDDIRTNINKLKAYVDEIEKLQNRIIASTGNEDRLRDELDERMEEAKRTSVKIKQDLKAILAGLNDKRTAFNRSPSDKKLETSIRIQSGQYSTLMNSFGETMQKFNDIEVSYMDKCKRIIQRQLSITGVNKTNEEVQEMLDSRNPKIFTQEIIAETRLARQALADVEARHNDIIKLEKSIVMINEMFLDLSEMIETQGEMVNNIELNVTQVDTNVEVGKDELHGALDNQRKARKKKCIVIGIVVLVIVIIIILLVILLSLYLPRNNGGGFG